MSPITKEEIMGTKPNKSLIVILKVEIKNLSRHTLDLSQLIDKKSIERLLQWHSMPTPVEFTVNEDKDYDKGHEDE